MGLNKGQVQQDPKGKGPGKHTASSRSPWESCGVHSTGTSKLIWTYSTAWNNENTAQSCWRHIAKWLCRFQLSLVQNPSLLLMCIWYMTCNYYIHILNCRIANYGHS